MWWQPERIEATVTRQFVCSHLLPEEIERLNRRVGFGAGLTDGTYWEWIDKKAKRIFLILLDLGVPDQIFGVIDDSWDDEDLPIARDQVGRLALTPAKDDKIETRFYHRQFHYLLRPLEKGEHMVYEDVEVVPLDVFEKKQVLPHAHSVEKVVLPNHPDKALCRRRIPLGSGPGGMSYEDFLHEINSIRHVQNEHLVSYFASYVHQGYGYVLFTPVSDFSLKSFVAATPTTFKNLEKKTRRELVLNWINCLVDTICSLHNRGLAHGNIKPSTVLFTNENHIFLSDFTRLNPELLATRADKTPFDKEAYDYAAPEQWIRSTSGLTSQAYRRATLTSLSSSPDKMTFSISRSGDHNSSSSSSSASMMRAATPHLNPQAADIFSLGCVILELLSFLMKKPTRTFATYRAAKNKTAGRGGAVLDSSFHKNLGQVESWMTQLAREASKKDDDVFRGVAPMLHVVERMLSAHPYERPAAFDVQTRMYEILHDACGVVEPHCVHQYGGWDFGIGNLKLTPPTGANNSSSDTMSILTRRSSGGRSFAAHRRTNSGGTGSARGSIMGSIVGSLSSGSSIPERPLSARFRQSEIGSSLQAIQNMRARADGPGQRQQATALGVGF